jgi:hypothetical protein
MGKSYSEKVAGVFEIVCCLLSVPASLGLVLSLYFWIIGVGYLAEKGNPNLLIIAFTILLMAVLGWSLVYGYAKHSRSALGAKKIKFMWLSSIIFNFLLSILAIYWYYNPVFTKLDFPSFQTLNSNSQILWILIYSQILWILIYYTIVAWQIVAMILPITALVSIKRNDNVR